jgi:hypothetical protein
MVLNNIKIIPGGCGKAEHLEKKKIFGPKLLDFFGQIIFGRLFTHILSLRESWPFRHIEKKG